MARGERREPATRTEEARREPARGSAAGWARWGGRRFRRNSYLVGFFGLLALIVGDGALSYHRVAFLEDDLRRAGQTNLLRLETALTLQETVANLAAEVRTFSNTRGAGEYARPAFMRVNRARRGVEQKMADAERVSGLAKSDEWQAFKAEFAAYEAELDVPETIDPTSMALERVEGAARELVAKAKHEAQAADDAATRIRKRAQRDIVLATTICFLAGLGVSLVTYSETRRRMRQLETAYAKISESRMFAESILEGMDSAVLTVDAQGAVTSINATALYALGLAAERDVVGRPLAEALSGRPQLLALVEPLAGSPPSGRRYLGRVELGRGWLFDVGASPLGWAGDSRGYIVTLSDVTEAERANEELRRNRALTAVGQMTAQVAHEIKNPLGGVQLAARLLERKLGDDPEALEIISRIKSSVDHLSRTVNELNQFARPGELSIEPVRLDELFEELLMMVADKVQAKGIRVERQYADDLPPGEFDGGELRKAFINFLVNALEASPDGAEVRISIEQVRHPVEQLRVAVRDRGVGMSEETLRRLFEPFYTTKSTGTGLGMAIARKIIEQHRGQLEVTSVEGRGTEVVVTLPLKHAHAARAEAEVGR